MKAPYSMFGRTLMVNVCTYTKNERDNPPRAEWQEDLWVERDEDMYALMSPQLRGKTVRVVYREDWLKARAESDRLGGGA